jgi:hypothetical protein
LHFSLFLFLGFDFEGINGKTLNRVYDEDDHVENFNQLRERMTYRILINVLSTSTTSKLTQSENNFIR